MSETHTRTIHTRTRRLPHWTTDNGTYFVTFRLADALSADLAARIASRRRCSVLTQRFLDRGHGRCWLRDWRVAAMVDRALRFFDGQRYLLHACTIMPNHVHAAMRVCVGFNLHQVTQAWKGYTARTANAILGRSGTFWQEESYDSLLHVQHDLERVIAYIVANPAKAHLTDWPWTTVLRTEFSFS
ncbi:MAG TPA: transposase [Thermoanaerobaculia bacterium]|jgi:REP element-mobilizing transposase RayT|nr:transposase [Thermoanaerobaculia bacterium]